MALGVLTATLSIRYYLSERFRLRFEDAGLDELMPEMGLSDPIADQVALNGPSDASRFESLIAPQIDDYLQAGVIRTLDGEEVGDEFAQDALNYQILLGKIDALLDRLKLDA